jgi:hypothetical protein
MRHRWFSATAIAAAMALTPTTSDALAPAVLLMIKQIVRQSASSMIKEALLSSLDGLGCKGIALSNAIRTVEVRRGGGPALGPPGGMAQIADVPPEMMATMRSMMPGFAQGPATMGLDPEQAAAMAQMHQAMAQPLSPRETKATIDELFELGFLPKPIQADLNDCMRLVPASLPALGAGMGMLKPIVPQLRQARQELRALSPAEQDEVAAAFVQEARALSREERAAFVEHLDSGFFPPRIATAVKQRLATP